MVLEKLRLVVSSALITESGVTHVYDCLRKPHVLTGRYVACAVPLTDTGAAIVPLRVNKQHRLDNMADQTGRLISSPASRVAAGCRPRAVRASSQPTVG